MDVDRKAIRRDAYHIHSLILRLIFIAFKLDGKLFAAVTFARADRDPVGRQKGRNKTSLSHQHLASSRPAPTSAIKMHKPPD